MNSQSPRFRDIARDCRRAYGFIGDVFHVISLCIISFTTCFPQLRAFFLAPPSAKGNFKKRGIRRVGDSKQRLDRASDAQQRLLPVRPSVDNIPREIVIGNLNAEKMGAKFSLSGNNFLIQGHVIDQELGNRVPEGWGTHLEWGSCVPVGDSGWICYALLQAVSTEGPESNGGGAVYAANCPEWEWHCDVEGIEGREARMVVVEVKSTSWC
jgi:hypothetical protein